ncbi:hypothetical protein [Ruminiclostridium cellulolyticum]|uniref:Adhesin domain-containing protein n=1 Tax=Ruminiclostridium cellulolyticum (strain ATCC 35319 / DSM 5812 / JCM 6584 / H10) TaxID=394503 RepID=B8I6J1_RUMCH|nr:hypothetical protein [Ruminiclostridium cellulolyticum]ACL74883.1 conserved hypothetical protein [Ruminiclostridium cellulolyticum H10]
MKRIPLCLVMAAFIILSSCGNDKIVLHKHSSYGYHNGDVKLDKTIKTLDVNIDSGKLQIYCWDNNEIKYEAKHVARGNKSDEALQELLKKYSVKPNQKEKTMYITVAYGGKIKNPQDFYTEIKLTIPRNIKNIFIKQDVGSISVEDKIDGNITGDVDSVNTEIKAMNGKLSWTCDTGSFRLGSGKLFSDSTVNIKAGNISSKAECQNNSQYLFKTDAGNVELSFPADSDVTVDSYGTLQNNQFTGINGNIKIKASTKMGKICVNGY